MATGWKTVVIPGKSYDFPAHNCTRLVLKPEQPSVSYVWRALSVGIGWFGRGVTADLHQGLNLRQSGLYLCSPHIILGLVFRSHSSVHRELGNISFPWLSSWCCCDLCVVVRLHALKGVLECDDERRTVSVITGKKEVRARTSMSHINSM